MGTQPSSPKGGGVPSPIFGPILLWPNGWMHQDAAWNGCRPQPRGLCVRWRPSPPSPKGAGAPKFSVHVYCGQTAAWIKMPRGTKVGLSPGDSVLDGDPAPSPHKEGGAPFQFSVHFYSGQTTRCIKIPLGMEVGLSLGDFVLDGDPAPLPKKEAEPGGRAPNFRPMSIVAKRLDR